MHPARANLSEGHFYAVKLIELQQLLLLHDLLGATPNSDWVDQLLLTSDVDTAQLLPTDQDSFPSYSPNQLVMLLMPLLEMSGRPPQAWLAAHESALLTANRHSLETLSPDGWLALLSCYSRLMYKPSEEFEGVFERYIVGVLPTLGAWGLASLVGSVARLQMPCSPQLEEGIVKRLDREWIYCRSVAAVVSGVGSGVGLGVAEQQWCTLLAAAGESLPSPAWWAAVQSALTHQLQALEATSAMQLLQSLKILYARPEPHFMEKLQQRLVLLVPGMSDMTLALMMLTLVECSCSPSLALQAAAASHIESGLVRSREGSGAAPVWLLLQAVLKMQQPPASAVLLDAVLLQAAEQMQAGSMSSSRLGRSLLLPLAAAVAPGGSHQEQQYNHFSHWYAAPGQQLAALLAALGRLQYVPVELPGWPEEALLRLQHVLPELEGHEPHVAELELMELVTVARALALFCQWRSQAALHYPALAVCELPVPWYGGFCG
eukprot:gene4494-4747_t